MYHHDGQPLFVARSAFILCLPGLPSTSVGKEISLLSAEILLEYNNNYTTAWDSDMNCSKLIVQRGTYIAHVCWCF